MKGVWKHIRSHVIRGVIATIPLALSTFVIYIIYRHIDRRVGHLLERLVGFSIPGIGLLTVLLVFYVVGFIATRTVGRQVVLFVDRATKRIPLIRTTYEIGKQLQNTLSLPEKQVFKRAVLVQYLKPGIWTVGFVTGSVVDESDQEVTYLKVFVPTPPNPTSGTMVLVREDMTRDPGWTVEEALKTVVSGGIIGPTEFRAPQLEARG
jgi:uncharacterized membrane protein